MNLCFMFLENTETKDITEEKSLERTKVLLEKIGRSKQSEHSFVQNSLLSSSLYMYTIYAFVVKDGVGNSSYASAFVWWAEYL